MTAAADHERSPAIANDAVVPWAGAGLALSAAVLMVTIALYAWVFGAAEATDRSMGVTTLDQARHLEANWSGLSATWGVEAAAFLLMAVVAIPLVGRTGGGVRWCPRPGAWALVGTGAILQASMYAFMLGGYPAGMAVADTAPALLEAVKGSAVFLFNLSNLALSLGIIAIYAAEAREGVLMTKRVGWIGLGLYVLAVLVAGALAGLSGLATAAPFGILAQAPVVFIGLRLRRWQPSTSAP